MKNIDKCFVHSFSLGSRRQVHKFQLCRGSTTSPVCMAFRPRFRQSARASRYNAASLLRFMNTQSPMMGHAISRNGTEPTRNIPRESKTRNDHFND